MKKIAIFDIDGTIFRSSLLIILVENLIADKIFPASAKKEFQNEHQAWLNRQADYETYISAVIKTFTKHIKGVHYGDFMECSKKTVRENKFKLYRYTRDLLPKLKKKGYFLLAVSQSPKGTLDKFCKNMGFDKVYGRLYELGPADRFTGKVEDLHHIANKANIVRRVVEKHNLTLEGSIGFGDTEDDISFLEKVDCPVAFNPNNKLYRHAKRNKWNVLVERKDVIYQISKSTDSPEEISLDF